jgi:hypothetical protein
MKNPSKKISPALFGLTLICFFMPFVTISCQEQPISSFTGVELARGTSVKSPSFGGNSSKQEQIPPNLFATMALLSGVVGFGTSFLKAKKSAIAPAGAGTAGFILLLMLKSQIDGEIAKQGQGILLASYGLGFWLAFLLFISAALVNIYTLVQQKDDNQPTISDRV